MSPVARVHGHSSLRAVRPRRRLSGDQVRGAWRRIRQRAREVEVLRVGPGESIRVLAQMLVPRGHNEKFDELVRDLAVTEQTPLTRAGAKPREANANHRIEKRGLALR